MADPQGVAYSFTVEVDGIKLDHVQEVTGLTIEIDKVEQFENDNKGKLVRNIIPGRHKSGDITITKLLKGGDKALQSVMLRSQAGDPTARFGGAITIRDAAGEELLSITMPPALLTKLEGNQGKANGTEIRTQKVTFAHNGLSVQAGKLQL